MKLVIDTNVFISALMKDSLTRKIIINSGFDFLIPEQELTEIKRYGRLILKKSSLRKEDLRDLIRRLLRYMTVAGNDVMLKYKGLTENVMGKIDSDDVIFIACALAFDCPIWSDDKHFIKQNKIRIFTTKEILAIYKNGNKIQE